ncbi:hypothetical protein SDC9_132507 [bioreactor metagenome]|uniref:Uncharacterized protein n=1 Tax=bioreactor metagenome TaxID=1076179 RepID=A0A645D7T6_9ZZZZ
MITRAAGSGSGRVPALNHEVFYHAVKDGSVIKAFIGKVDKVSHRVGRDIVIQLHFDDAAGLHFDGGYGYFCNHKSSSEQSKKWDKMVKSAPGQRCRRSLFSGIYREKSMNDFLFL